MKKSLVLLSVLSLFALQANAESNSRGKKLSNNYTSSAAQANASARSNASANATGGSVKSTISNSVKNNNEQFQGQSQSTDNANNASLSVNVAGDNESRHPVSTAYAPSMSPSSQCMGVATGGVQGVSFGVSLGKSYESKQCNQRELARMFAQMGKTDSAMEVLCSIEGSESVTQCKQYKNNTTELAAKPSVIVDSSSILDKMGK